MDLEDAVVKIAVAVLAWALFVQNIKRLKHKCKDEPDLMYNDRLYGGGGRGDGWCSV